MGNVNNKVGTCDYENIPTSDSQEKTLPCQGDDIQRYAPDPTVKEQIRGSISHPHLREEGGATVEGAEAKETEEEEGLYENHSMIKLVASIHNISDMEEQHLEHELEQAELEQLPAAPAVPLAPPPSQATPLSLPMATPTPSRTPLVPVPVQSTSIIKRLSKRLSNKISMRRKLKRKPEQQEAKSEFYIDLPCECDAKTARPEDNGLYENIETTENSASCSNREEEDVYENHHLNLTTPGNTGLGVAMETSQNNAEEVYDDAHSTENKISVHMSVSPSNPRKVSLYENIDTLRQQREAAS